MRQFPNSAPGRLPLHGSVGLHLPAGEDGFGDHEVFRSRHLDVQGIIRDHADLYPVFFYQGADVREVAQDGFGMCQGLPEPITAAALRGLDKSE